jgi:hypothetical protein
MNLILNISTFETELTRLEKKIYNLNVVIDKKRLIIKCQIIAQHLLMLIEETREIIENSSIFLKI